MSEEKLMRKYGYGYKHSKDLLNEPYVKDLQQRIDKAINKIDLILKYTDPADIYQFVDIQDKFIDVKATLKGDNND